MTSLPYPARLLFLGLIIHADDWGYVGGDPGALKETLFPADDLSIADVADLCHALDAVRMICLYESGDRQVIHVRNFTVYQRLSEPGSSTFPPCPRCGTPRKLAPLPVLPIILVRPGDVPYEAWQKIIKARIRELAALFAGETAVWEWARLVRSRSRSLRDKGNARLCGDLETLRVMDQHGLNWRDGLRRALVRKAGSLAYAVVVARSVGPQHQSPLIAPAKRERFDERTQAIIDAASEEGARHYADLERRDATRTEELRDRLVAAASIKDILEGISA